MRFRLATACLSAILLLAMCGPQPEPRLLTDGQLAKVAADLYTAEGATYNLAGYDKDSTTHAYFKQVFEKHHLTVEQYEREMRLITDDVPRLEAMLLQAEKIVKERDSLANQR